MPQPSKKSLIATQALPLFLQHGIKGTSIDMVVKASGVSKPTVYNHFPDKASLLASSIALWLAEQPEPAFKARSQAGLERELAHSWLTPTAVRLYGLFMGEGARAPQAAQQFLLGYDDRWQQALVRWATKHQLDARDLRARAADVLLTALTNPLRAI